MLCDLPPEIIIQIFAKLSPDDLSSCKLINKYLHNIIAESHVLQYRAALLLARADDNPCSDQLVVEKLEALKSAENAWSHVQPRFKTTVPVTHQQSGVYDLTGGVYLLSNANRTALYYIKLPTSKEEDVQWKSLVFTKTIIDIGLCLFEHDLIVIVTTTPRPQPNGLPTTFDIELQYLQFSTGKPHPRARQSRVLVANLPWQKPAVGIEIVGYHLVLILSFSNGQRPDDRVYIYDWINDVLKTSFLAPYRSYAGLIFLTEDLILVPNVRTNSLDIFRIPEKPIAETLVPILVLRLPELAEERLMGGISCRAEPNPIGSKSSLFARRDSRKQEGNITETAPERGFLASAEDAICIFEMRILVLRLNLLQGGWNINFQPRDRFSFIAHRSAFVNLVELHGKKDGEESRVQTSAGEVHEPEPSPSTATTAGSTQGHEEGTAEPQPGEHGPETNPNQPPEHEEEEEEATSIPWAEWGPPISRWFNSDDVSTRWITISAGQRYVRMQENPPRGGLPFTILDFNPRNVAKMKKELELRAKKNHDNGKQDENAVAGSSHSTPPIIETHYEIPGGLDSSTPMILGSSMHVFPDEYDNAGDSQSNSDVTEIHDLPEGLDSSTPIVLGSSMHNVDMQDIINSQEGSTSSANNDTATTGSTSTSIPDQGVEYVGTEDLFHDDEEIHPDISSPVLMGLIDVDDDDEDEFEEDEGDGLSNFAYDDAEMELADEVDDDDDDVDFDEETNEHTGYAEESDGAPDEPVHSDDGTERERIRVVTSFDQVEPSDAFSEPVEGGLPFVACESEERYDFDGVLMDEERVIGVKTNAVLDFIEKVEILYFG